MLACRLLDDRRRVGVGDTDDEGLAEFAGGSEVLEMAVVEGLEAAVDHAVFGFHGRDDAGFRGRRLRPVPRELLRRATEAGWRAQRRTRSRRWHREVSRTAAPPKSED